MMIEKHWHCIFTHLLKPLCEGDQKIELILYFVNFNYRGQKNRSVLKNVFNRFLIIQMVSPGSEIHYG